jgi:hypothetical protein
VSPEQTIAELIDAHARLLAWQRCFPGHDPKPIESERGRALSLVESMLHENRNPSKGRTYV